MKVPRAATLAALLVGAVATYQPAAAQMAGNPDEMVSYRVRAGESLYSISDKYLTQRASYVVVQRLNRIANPFKLPPGKVINIPTRLLKATPLNAQLAAFQGDIRIENRGALLTPVIGMQIQPGVVVQTGKLGFLTVALSNGSRITLPSNSRVRILQMRRFLLTGSTDFDFSLDKGRVETTVTSTKDTNSRFRLRTPIAVSAVRGTQFRIGYEEGQASSATEVVEGNVAVGANAAPSAAALVPAGFGATASADGRVGTEKLLAAPTVLKPGALQKEPTVKFDFTPLPSARGYHVQLAKDAGFVDMIAETRGTGTQAQFEGIPDGNYFVRAMAIAPSGLEGLSETYGIRRQLTALGASAGALGPGQYQFKWFGAGSGKRVYRFQLLAKAGDTIPLIDETGLEKNEMLLSGLTPGIYFWRVGVRQFGENGMSESWTPAEKFTISKPE